MPKCKLASEGGGNRALPKCRRKGKQTETKAKPIKLSLEHVRAVDFVDL